MTREIYLGLLRHGLTMAGAALAAKGFGDDELWAQVVGAVVAVAGAVLSAMDKRKVEKAAAAASTAAATAATNATLNAIEKKFGSEAGAAVRSVAGKFSV